MIFTAALVAALSSSPATPAVSGDYVEARTASVYAGACHYGGEYTTQGRDAVLGWHFTGGAVAGVELAGVDVVAVVSADANLAEPGSRRTVLYLDAAASLAQREAARAWLAANRADVLGEIVRVKTAGVDVVRAGDDFRISAGPDVALSGSAMPDRECCRMAFNVWYEPLAPTADRLVGNTAEFRVHERALGAQWSRPGENAVFFGRF